MVKSGRLEKAALPNGKTFHAKYKKFGRNALPNNVTIKRICTKEEQKAREISDLETY